MYPISAGPLTAIVSELARLLSDGVRNENGIFKLLITMGTSFKPINLLNKN